MEKKRIKRATSSEQPQYVVQKEGVYLLIVTFRPVSLTPGNHSFTAKLVIDMKSDLGYLSVVDWPLLPVNYFVSPVLSEFFLITHVNYSFTEPCVDCTRFWECYGS